MRAVLALFDDRPEVERARGIAAVMMQDDFERLHKYMLEIERVDAISDEMRAVVEDEWPELAHKLPPKERH